MPNSAHRLAALLSSWSIDNEPVLEARAGENAPDSLEFWRTQAEAVALVREVDAMIKSLAGTGQDVAPFEEYLPDFYRAVFSADVGWVDRAHGDPLERHPMNGLKMLGLYWDSASLSVSPLTPESREGLLGALLDARDAILAIPSLSQTEREYVFRLVDGAHSFVDEHEVLGAADLRAHIERVSGALLSVVAQLPENESGERQAVVKALDRIVIFARNSVYDLAAIATVYGTAAPGIIQG